MIQVSQNVINACNSDSLIYKEYIIIEGQKVIIKAKFSDDCYYNGNFIGSFILKKLEFETENDIDYKEKEFVYYREINGESFKIGTFIVQDVKDSDTQENVKVVAYDYGLKFANTYQTKLLYANGGITLRQVLQEVCDNVGVFLSPETFTNQDFIVDSNQFEATAQYGNVVSEVAKISCNFAKIDENDTLKLIFKNETNEIIEDYEDLEDKRDTQPITCVSLGMSDIEGENVVLKWEEGIDLYGENWIIINDNPFAYTQEKRTQLIQAIFDKVKGFGYSSFESKFSFKPYLQCGDLVQLRNKNGQLVNSIVLRVYAEHQDIELSAPSVIKATVEYQQPLEAIDIAKRTEIIVDKQNQTITSIVENVDEQNQKISKITQTVDEINSKLSDVADITTSKESMNGVLDFEGINESEPIYIKIYPISGNISKLYPRANLYPSPDLFMKGRILRFTNITTNEVFNYELPTDLLFYNTEIYDEFILSYDGLNCMVNKRVGYNADGTTYTLDKEQILEFEFPKIPLTDGDYRIELLGHPSVYMFIRLMSQNIYTTQFATKAELSSEISQTKSEISLSVDKKLESYPTTTQMNSAISITAESINSEVRKKVGEDEIISSINQSAEGIKISANNIDINGVISANGNFKVKTDGTMECTGATINVNDNGYESGSSGMSADSNSYKANYYSDGIDIYNKNVSNADFALFRPNSITAYNYGRYGFDFFVGSDNRISWTIRDMLGRLISAGDTQFNLYSPGEDTNLSLRNNGAYINGYKIQTATSDARLKTNIKNSEENALKKIMQIQHRSFDWIENGEHQKNGYIAQELEQIDKEFVINDNDKYSINLLNVLSTVTKAMQEQQAQIEELKQEIKKLKEAK